MNTLAAVAVTNCRKSRDAQSGSQKSTPIASCGWRRRVRQDAARSGDVTWRLRSCSAVRRTSRVASRSGFQVCPVQPSPVSARDRESSTPAYPWRGGRPRSSATGPSTSSRVRAVLPRSPRSLSRPAGNVGGSQKCQVVRGEPSARVCVVTGRPELLTGPLSQETWGCSVQISREPCGLNHGEIRHVETVVLDQRDGLVREAAVLDDGAGIGDG